MQRLSVESNLTHKNETKSKGISKVQKSTQKLLSSVAMNVCTRYYSKQEEKSEDHQNL